MPAEVYPEVAQLSSLSKWKEPGDSDEEKEPEERRRKSILTYFLVRACCWVSEDRR